MDTHLHAVPALAPGGEGGPPSGPWEPWAGHGRGGDQLVAPCPGATWPSAVQAALLHRYPWAWLSGLQRRHGDVFAVRLLHAGPVVVVADPAVAARLMDADPEAAHAGAARRRVVGMVSAGSVLGGDGAVHRAARDALAPVFAEDAVARIAPAIREVARSHVVAWPRRRPFRLLPRMRSLTDDVAVQLLLGVEGPTERRELGGGLRRLVRFAGAPPVPVPRGDAGMVGHAVAGGFDRRARALTHALGALADARGAPRTGVRREDLLDRLVERTAGHEALAEQVLPLLLAGQEPAASALTWVLERAAREPAAACAFLDDALVPRRVATGTLATPANPFVAETLRLRPPVPAVLRHLTRPFDAGDVELPAGTTVLVSTLLLHRDPRVFSTPEEFRPHRWGRAPAPGAYAPFGGGARRCLGEALAATLLAAVVPEVLGAVRLRPVAPLPERVVLRANVTVPHLGGLVVAEDR